MDLQPALEGWSIHALDAEEYRPRPENNCWMRTGSMTTRPANGCSRRSRTPAARPLTVDLVEFGSETAATDAYEMLVKLDIVCVVPNLAGLSDVEAYVGLDSWLQIGGGRSYGWQAGRLRQPGGVFPTLYDAVAFVER